jgi:arginyl-tRNA synthetase
MDPADALKSFGIPILGAVSGWVTAAIKTAGRVTNLEAAFESYKKTQEKAFEDFKKATKEHFEEVIRDIRRQHEEQKKDAEKTFEELKKELGELDASFDRFTRASQHDFAKDEEFNRFVEEMNRQWKQVERALGHIEGWMKATQGVSHESPYPQSPIVQKRRG